MREWFDSIWEFCQDHLMALVVAAVILVILLLSIIFARSARREALLELENEEEADENQGIEQMASFEKGQASGKAEDCKGAELHDKTGISLVSPELQDMVHTMAKLPLQNLKSVELKIEKAQLTLRYDLTSEEENSSAGDEETIDGTTQMEIFSEPVSVDLSAQTDLKDMEMEMISEETPEEESKPVVKFGTENLSVTRSGREFTIEELYHQIKD